VRCKAWRSSRPTFPPTTSSRRRRFTFAKGALVTALISFAFQPWRLVVSSSVSFRQHLAAQQLGARGPHRRGPRRPLHCLAHRSGRRRALLGGQGQPLLLPGWFQRRRDGGNGGRSGAHRARISAQGICHGVQQSLVRSFLVAGAVYCLLCGPERDASKTPVQFIRHTNL